MGVDLTVYSKAEDYQIASFEFKGPLKNDGQQYNTTEAGNEYNIIRYEDYAYNLKLQYLTIRDIKNLTQQISDCKRLNQLINLKNPLSESKGFLNFSGRNGDDFRIDPAAVKPTRHKGTDLWSVSLSVVERKWY
ncbi:MAG: hypothetical protein ACRCTW_07700 [Lactococcus garvieae]